MPEPFPKERQLARGQKRYRRKIASAKDWQKITAAKLGPCRVCNDTGTNGRMYGKIQMHHVVPRSWHGDDNEDNIVPLCPGCHDDVTLRDRDACYLMAASLTDAEYAYAISKCGENALERIYGVVAR